MATMKRVFISLAEEYGYARQVLRGVHDYVHNTARPWIFNRYLLATNTTTAITNWSADGLIIQMCFN
ncbi:MAG: hypothetical protein WCJ56_05675 [bacterium]